jgi:hypothetical protein
MCEIPCVTDEQQTFNFKIKGCTNMNFSLTFFFKFIFQKTFFLKNNLKLFLFLFCLYQHMVRTCLFTIIIIIIIIMYFQSPAYFTLFLSL